MLVLSTQQFDELRDAWRSRWEEALAAWSRFTKLAEPRWCESEKDEIRQHLRDSFAMIRLTDHAIVISLRQIADLKLDRFAREIMAHEVGHHVYAPGDLRDNARLLARVRAGLPTRESFSGLVANLYTDLLINDRLQRSAGLDIGGVYKAIRNDKPDRVWKLYMRIYEVLWSLPAGTLAEIGGDAQLEADAGLGARVVRVYARDWLKGAGRFAALMLPYFLEMEEPKALIVRLPPWFDTQEAGGGAEIPDGLVEIEDDELDGAIHPSEDPAITGLGEGDAEGKKRTGADAGGREKIGGIKNRYRPPSEYKELMESLGVRIPEQEIVMRYYRELAIPYLIRFPTREVREASDPLPEGVEEWDAGMPIHEIDWIETTVRSPHVIPGVTTVKRTYGASEGNSPEKIPVDLYIGIDCSGSMGNPAHTLSYPVLAGTIVGISALRAGARVMVCLSGEPGKYSQTDGFVRSEKEILRILTGYLGTGYSFGILRLRDTFLVEDYKPSRPAHILVVSDNDIFQMLDQLKKGWEIAQKAVARVGGGGTFVLEIPKDQYPKQVNRMREIGWNVWQVSTQEELVAFAREFSKINYERQRVTRGVRI